MTEPVLPPGPRGLEAMRVLSGFGKDPLGSLVALKRRYGPAVRLPGPIVQTLFLTPAAVEQVLITQNKSFGRGRLNAQFQLLDGLGLVTSEGDLWVRQRRMAQPLFHRQRLAALGAVMAEETARAVGRWDAKATEGRAFDVVPELMRLTLQSAGRTLFGVDLEHSASAIGPAVDAAREYISWRTKFAFLPVWLPTPLRSRFLRAKKLLDDLVFGLIAQRRREGAQGRNDLLSLFVEAVDVETGATMDDQQVRDEVMTLLMAGHESTAVTLSWVLFLVGRHPEVQRKIREELDAALGGRPPTAEDLPRLAYLRMAIEETLRLYPPVWAMSRQAVEDVVVDGFRVPKGEHVMLAQWVVHRDPEIWEEPEAFRPERFAPAASERRPRGIYFPFGAGPRSCIGNHFALMEATLVAATMLQRFEVQLPGGPVEMDPQISLRLKGGTQVIFKPVAAPRAPTAPAAA